MGDKEIRPVVWPTTEPDRPTRQEPEIRPEVRPEIRPQAPATPEVAAQPIEAAPALPTDIDAAITHAFIWHNAAAAAAVVRTMIQREDPCTDDETLAQLTARQVAAAFLSALGVAISAQVMRHLQRDDEARWVGRALAEEPAVTHRIAMAALQAVRRNIEEGEYLQEGGAEYATRLFEEAFPHGRAAGLLRPAEDESPGFGSFDDVAPEQLAPYVSHEHPQTIALFLSQLRPLMAARILASFPQAMQADVAYRVARLEQVEPRALIGLRDGMEASFCDILSAAAAVDGPKAAADILKRCGASLERNVLDRMDAQAPELAEKIRDLMFTFADLDKLTDRELQIVLQEADQKDLVISMKACSEDLRQRLLQNLSAETRSFLSEELKHLATMRLSEAEEVQSRVVKRVRQLEQQGKVTIVRDDTGTVWV